MACKNARLCVLRTSQHIQVGLERRLGRVESSIGHISGDGIRRAHYRFCHINLASTTRTAPTIKTRILWGAVGFGLVILNYYTLLFGRKWSRY